MQTVDYSELIETSLRYLSVVKEVLEMSEQTLSYYIPKIHDQTMFSKPLRNGPLSPDKGIKAGSYLKQHASFYFIECIKALESNLNELQYRKVMKLAFPDPDNLARFQRFYSDLLFLKPDPITESKRSNFKPEIFGINQVETQTWLEIVDELTFAFKDDRINLLSLSN